MRCGLRGRGGRAGVGSETARAPFRRRGDGARPDDAQHRDCHVREQCPASAAWQAGLVRPALVSVAVVIPTVVASSTARRCTLE